MYADSVLASRCRTGGPVGWGGRDPASAAWRRRL